MRVVGVTLTCCHLPLSPVCSWDEFDTGIPVSPPPHAPPQVPARPQDPLPDICHWPLACTWVSQAPLGGTGSRRGPVSEAHLRLRAGQASLSVRQHRARQQRATLWAASTWGCWGPVCHKHSCPSPCVDIPLFLLGPLGHVGSVRLGETAQHPSRVPCHRATGNVRTIRPFSAFANVGCWRYLTFSVSSHSRAGSPLCAAPALPRSSLAARVCLSMGSALHRGPRPRGSLDFNALLTLGSWRYVRRVGCNDVLLSATYLLISFMSF